AYARDLVAAVPDRHISFEVFSDDIPEMVAQANVIAGWGPNVYVKLPVTTTRGELLFPAVRALSRDGVKVNLTAIFGADQVVGRIVAWRRQGVSRGCHRGRAQPQREPAQGRGVGRQCRMGRANKSAS